MNIIANMTADANALKYITPFGYTEGSDLISTHSIEMKYLIPGMIFMLVMTIWKLILTVVALFGKVGAGAAAWGDWFQLVFAVAMLILAVILVIEGIQTLGKQKASKKA